MVATYANGAVQQVMVEDTPVVERLPIVYVRYVLGPAQGMDADDYSIRMVAVEPGTEEAFGRALAAAFRIGNRRQVIKLQRRQQGVDYPLDAYDQAVHNRRQRFGRGNRQQQELAW
jgi:hypothetical protein